MEGFYGEIEEELPPGMLEPLGKSSRTVCFVHDNHVSNILTQC